jgi:hypothetical protein
VRRVAVAVALAVALAVSAPARAAEWGTIVPASSTMDAVRAQFGGPTRTETQKVETYDTTSWVYEGAQAPRGIRRMVVEFGILQAGGFRRDVVRIFRLEPNPGVFTRDTVFAGWGRPDGVSKADGSDSYLYDEGLIVVFEKETSSAASLVFMPPQPGERGRSR